MIPFMVTGDLPEEFSAEFIKRIPEQRTVINDLLEKGVISSYALSADRATLWITLVADDVDSVEKVLAAFPLKEFITFDIRELMFHNTSGTILPQIILN